MKAIVLAKGANLNLSSKNYLNNSGFPIISAIYKSICERIAHMNKYQSIIGKVI